MKVKDFRFSVFWWFAVLSIIGTLMHYDMIDSGSFEQQQILHNEIITHTAPAPYQYRILQPVIVETFLRTLSPDTAGSKYRIIFLGTYAFIRFLSLLTTFIAVFITLKQLWPDETAVLAATSLAAFVPFTYRYYYYQPTSVLEMAFFALGLLAIFRRKSWALLPLVVMGTLNRETMCFIPFAYFMYWLPSLKKNEWIWLAVSTVSWVLIFVGIRVIWPAPSNLLNISHYILTNLSSIRGNIDLITILSPGVLIILYAKKIPHNYFRLALCSVPWLILHFFTAQWFEIRYYMPVLIWFIPGIVHIFSVQEQEKKVKKGPM